MSSKQTPASQAQLSPDMFGMFAPAMDYAIDATQRTLLFWDVMRQRGNQYREHLAETVPNVLSYEADLIIDGRALQRPVNYGLVRIVPPQGVTIDPHRRPLKLDRASLSARQPREEFVEQRTRRVRIEIDCELPAQPILIAERKRFRIRFD